MQSLTASTQEHPADTLYLHLFKGKDTSTFSYYEDDGISHNYEHGDFYRREITYRPESCTLELGIPSGDRASIFKTVKLILHGFADPEVTSSSGRLDVRKTDCRLFDPLENIRGYYET